MERLVEKVEQLMSVNEADYRSLYEISLELTESLATSSSEVIVNMLTYSISKYYMELPFWLRLLSFKLAIIQDPDNMELRKWAESDLIAFGGPRMIDVVKSW